MSSLTSIHWLRLCDTIAYAIPTVEYPISCSDKTLIPLPTDAMHKTSVPCVLVSCKCDNHPAYRQVDPTIIEQKARASFGEMPAMQTSEGVPEGYRKCMTALMRAIMAARYGECFLGLVSMCQLP